MNDNVNIGYNVFGCIYTVLTICKTLSFVSMANIFILPMDQNDMRDVHFHSYWKRVMLMTQMVVDPTR